MTEYELGDLIATYASNMMTFFTVYLTLLTGYLITAFVAGPKLSLAQVSILNVGFVISAGLLTFAVAGAGIIRGHYTLELLELAADSPHQPTSWLVITFSILMVGGVIASLYFMWNSRYPKTE